MKTVASVDDIPEFESEREESDFWANHELSEEVWSNAKPLPKSILPPAGPRAAGPMRD